MTGKRAYKSTLREGQAKQTRALIVEALIEQVCDTGRNDLSMNEIAERAGVSVRTVYRHFPKREDLFDAIHEELHGPSAPNVPEGIEDVGEHMQRLFDWFEANPRLVEASHVAGLGREVRRHGRRRRGEEMREMMDVWLGDLPEAQRVRAWAVTRSFFSSYTWRTMRFELGLDAEATSDAFAWVLELMMDDLKRRRAAPEEGE